VKTLNGLIQKVTLLEGELAEAYRAQEAVEEKFYNLSATSTDGMHDWWFLRRNARGSLRSILFCRPGASSYVLPSSARHS
jgi:hypothetical protein